MRLLQREHVRLLLLLLSPLQLHLAHVDGVDLQQRIGQQLLTAHCGEEI